MNGRLAMHETLDLHELVGLKDVCARKASAMQMMVQDPQLRHFLQQDLQSSRDSQGSATWQHDGRQAVMYSARAIHNR